MNEDKMKGYNVKYGFVIFFGLYGVLGFFASVGFLFLLSMGSKLIAGGVVSILLSLSVYFVVSKMKEVPSGKAAYSIMLFPLLFNTSILAITIFIAQGRMGSPLWGGVSLLNLSFLPLIIIGELNGNVLESLVMISVFQVIIAVSGMLALGGNNWRTMSVKYKRMFIGVTVFAITILSASVYSQSYFQKRNAEIVGYGFEYGDGFSSVDISKYNPSFIGNQLAKLDDPSTFYIENIADMPILDGAEAAYPVYAAFAAATYNPVVFNGNEKEKKEYGKDDIEPRDPVSFTNTIYAFESLVDGTTDIFFGAKPSQKQVEYAKSNGVELEITPIGKEAFIFIVSSDNTIDNLTSEQIRDIYSGKIRNWKDVGGADQQILAYQRPEDSGSQTMMQYFMNGTPLMKPLKAEYIQGMGGTYEAIASYNGQPRGIGYSFRFFSNMSGKTGFKVLKIDDIAVTDTTIESGEYPLVTNLVAVTVKGNPKKMVEPFVEWMVGEQGSELVKKTGYVV